MRRLDGRGILLGIALLAAACGGPKGTLVGSAVTVKKPVEMVALSAMPASFSGQTVRLEGTVKAVCQGMGCWVEVQDASGASFMARSLDHTILLPTDCTGKHVVVQGVVTAMPADACSEETHADHAATPDHVCPKPDFVVATTGIVLQDR